MKCVSCGQEVQAGDHFCPHCGTSVAAATLSESVAGTGSLPPADAGTPAAVAQGASAVPASPAPAAPPPASGQARPAPHASKLPLIGAAVAVILVAGIGGYFAVRAFTAPDQTTLVPPPAPPAASPPSPSPPAAASPPSGPAPPAAGSTTTTASPPSDPIDIYLAAQICHNCTCLYSNGTASPLTGNGSSFDANGQTYSLDPRLAVAIAGQETSFGLHTGCFANHNAWNWFWCYASNSCAGNAIKNSPFSSWSNGIATVNKFLRKSYINKGYTTVSLIGHVYCPPGQGGCSAWAPGVSNFLQQLGGSPGQLEQ